MAVFRLNKYIKMLDGRGAPAPFGKVYGNDSGVIDAIKSMFPANGTGCIHEGHSRGKKREQLHR